jgi:hypothetical protein
MPNVPASLEQPVPMSSGFGIRRLRFRSRVVELSQIEPFQLVVVASKDSYANDILLAVSTPTQPLLARVS